MKYCLSCHNPIQELNPNELWCMFITKKGQRITAFECFHKNCWEKFFNDSILLKIREMKK